MSPKEPMLHLSFCPCTSYQLQLASSSRHEYLYIEQPQAQHPPTSTHYYESTSPPEVWDLLVSDASWYITERLKITLQNILFHRSWLVEWSSHPYPDCWKLISFNTTWLHHKKIFFKSFTFSKSSSFSLSFSSSLASLYLFEQCLRLGVTSTFSVCLPLQDESLYVFPNCKSLWIKALCWIQDTLKGTTLY